METSTKILWTAVIGFFVVSQSLDATTAQNLLHSVQGFFVR